MFIWWLHIVLNKFDYAPNNEARMEGFLLVLYRITCAYSKDPKKGQRISLKRCRTPVKNKQ